MAMVRIRPATPKDLSQVRDIVVYYVRHSSLTFVQNPVSQAVFDARFHDITESRRLPYLVAIEEDVDNNREIVVGYTHLSPFRGHMLSYGPTVELTLFVHPHHQSHSVGTRLLAAVLESARLPGVVHRAREVTVDDDGLEHTVYAEVGRGVRLRNILAVMAVDPEGKDGGEALRRWYVKRGFVERGRLDKIGFKKGRW